MVENDSADEVESLGMLSELNETHLKQGVTLTLDGKRMTRKAAPSPKPVLSATTMSEPASAAVMAAEPYC